MKTRALATRLSAELVDALDEVCRKTGMRKNFVLEAAIRDKIEDVLDAEDLRLAMSEATGFSSWAEVKRASRGSRRR
jgi:predicted DNA-binding protein